MFMFDSAIIISEWFIAGAASLVAALFVLTYLPALIIKHVQRRALMKACRGKLILTYDDGPDPLLTPLLLDLLKRYNAKATFFLLGFRAERSPQMCDLLVRHGHELGCHAHWHLDSHLLTPWRAIANMRQGYRTMERWMPRSAPFRPPYGKLTTWLWLALLYRGAPLRWWTADGRDTYAQLPDPRETARQISEQGGAVVLMHSHDRGEERQNYVLTLTEELLIAAKRTGLQHCTMRDLYRADFRASEK